MGRRKKAAFCKREENKKQNRKKKYIKGKLKNKKQIKI